MSEINAIRNAIRAERELVKTEQAAKTFDDVVDKRPPNVVKTATGAKVDISKGYNVRGPDGLKIPFNVNTPLEKAKEWTKNFYRPESDFETVQLKKRIKSLEDPTPTVTTYSMRDNKNTYMGSKGYDQITYDVDHATGKYIIRASQIQDKFKGKGIGAGMYRILFNKAIKEGVPVRSDSGMTPASIAVWRRFKELGYPIVEHPMEKMTSGAYKRAGVDLGKDAPLFEFDPSKMKPKVETPVPKPDEADKLIQGLRTQKGIEPELRERILDTYNDYKITEDPDARQELLNSLKNLLPKSENQ